MSWHQLPFDIQHAILKEFAFEQVLALRVCTCYSDIIDITNRHDSVNYSKSDSESDSGEYHNENDEGDNSMNDSESDDSKSDDSKSDSGEYHNENDMNKGSQHNCQWTKTLAPVTSAVIDYNIPAVKNCLLVCSKLHSCAVQKQLGLTILYRVMEDDADASGIHLHPTVYCA
jgi:cobalamin biosynthesis protein CobT